jgi:hypothetical protein
VSPEGSIQADDAVKERPQSAKKKLPPKKKEKIGFANEAG